MKWWLLTCAIALSLVLLYLDPYSQGFRGGDLYVIVHPWQRTAVGCEAVLLVVGLMAAILGRPRVTVKIVVIEAAVFVALNVAWIIRDGTTRFLIGYENSIQTAYFTAAGLFLRALILVWLTRLTRVSLPHKASSEAGRV